MKKRFLYSRLVAETRGTVAFASVPPALPQQQAPTHQQPPQAPDTLTLTVASPDAFPWSPCLAETMTTSLNVQAPWAITVLPPEDNIGSAAAFPASEGTGVSAASFSKKGIELPHEPAFPQAE